MKVKWNWSVFWDVIWIVATVGAGAWLAYNVSIDYYSSWMAQKNEFSIYAMMALCALRLFHRGNQPEKGKGRLVLRVLAFVGGFTVLVCLYNNLLHFLEWNSRWGDVFQSGIVPFSHFLKKDLTYTAGYGEFRYPKVALIMLLGCLGDLALFHTRAGKRFTQTVKDVLDTITDFSPYSEYIFIQEPDSRHADDIASLLQKTGQTMTWHDLCQLSETARVVTYIAELDYDVVGMITATIRELGDGKKVGEVILLALPEKAPCRTLSYALEDKMEARLRDEGCALVITTPPEKSSAKDAVSTNA